VILCQTSRRRIKGRQLRNRPGGRKVVLKEMLTKRTSQGGGEVVKRILMLKEDPIENQSQRKRALGIGTGIGNESQTGDPFAESYCQGNFGSSLQI
jgi:hypothetical protein